MTIRTIEAPPAMRSAGRPLLVSRGGGCRSRGRSSKGSYPRAVVLLFFHCLVQVGSRKQKMAAQRFLDRLLIVCCSGRARGSYEFAQLSLRSSRRHGALAKSGAGCSCASRVTATSSTTCRLARVAAKTTATWRARRIRGLLWRDAAVIRRLTASNSERGTALPHVIAL